MPPARSIFRLLPFLGVAVLAVMLAGCTEEYSWKQKITVTVGTPDGEVSGSSVQQVDGGRLKTKVPGQGGSASVKVRGEAVVVDLSGGRYLFALLKGAAGRGDAGDLVQSLVAPKQGAETKEALSAASALPVGRTFEIDGERRPLLVTFDDITNPTTVRRVDPYDLVSMFGPGYTLNAITLEITDEKATRDIIESVLTWLGPYPEPKLGPVTGGTQNIPFYRMVAHGDFIRR